MAAHSALSPPLRLWGSATAALSSRHRPEISAFHADCFPALSPLRICFTSRHGLPFSRLLHYQPFFFTSSALPCISRGLSIAAPRTRQRTETVALDVGRMQEGGISRAQKEEEEEVGEEDISWIREKTEDLFQMTGTAINAIPGPRVGQTSVPWLLAVPIGYLSITFVISVIKTIRKYNSPTEKRRRLVGRNSFLCKSLDKFLPSKRLELDNSTLKTLERQTNFNTQEILRKYIRYALNERPFNPDTVADLIHLRKVSQLEDAEAAEILNEVSRRIVKEKGPVVMDTRGFTEKGIKRKAAVQALLSKILYLSELDEFCSSWSLLKIKEIFGVTDEDADTIRIETLSEVSDMESLEMMVQSDSEIEENTVENG